jgi:chromosomal replication initiation ATPase DnaA
MTRKIEKRQDTLCDHCHQLAIDPPDLGGEFQQRVADSVTMAQIIKAVAEKYMVSVEELEGPSRQERLIIPRHEAIWLMRQRKLADGRFRWSYPMIGRRLGGRDHTTAINGFRRHEERMAMAA